MELVLAGLVGLERDVAARFRPHGQVERDPARRPKSVHDAKHSLSSFSVRCDIARTYGGGGGYLKKFGRPDHEKSCFGASRFMPERSFLPAARASATIHRSYRFSVADLALATTAADLIAPIRPP